PADGGGSCPQGWGASDFDDSGWQKMTLPMASVPTGGVCLRAQFDVGSSLARYRWLHITLSSRSRAQLNFGKPLSNGVDQQGGLDWSTDDDDPTLTTPVAANRSYTLDLRLFPSLLQAQRNVLALEIAESGSPIDIQAVLAEDDGSPDNIAQLTKQPYRVRPSATSTRIAWESDRSAPSWLVVDGQQYDGGWSMHHEVEIDGLVAGRLYSYYVSTAQESALPAACQAMVAAPASSAKLTLSDLTDDEFAKYLERRDACNRLAQAIHSPPQALRSTALGAPVRVAIVGATRMDGSWVPPLLAAVAAERPDLVVHTGDVVADGADGEWQSFFDASAAMLSAAPLAPVPGEHDLVPWPGYSDRFSQLFGLGGAAGRAYSLDVGAVHLAFLDSTVSLDNQAAWLDSDLDAAAARGVRHSFVVMHWGPWTAGAAGAAALAAIVPVAERHGVQAIVSGHENIYEHGLAGGQHYFVTGGGAVTVIAVHKPTTVTSRGVPHYLLLEVSGDTATMRAKDVNGAVFDEVTL
ncbi:MAG: metallophosphoesterase, partial [bacterium]|nr:metallophosphoesterase [bacterium]